jgi:hypothetical protein
LPNFGHVRATLKGLADVLERRVDFDYVVLLTAQDYPLRSAADIERNLGAASVRTFKNHWLLRSRSGSRVEGSTVSRPGT